MAWSRCRATRSPRWSVTRSSTRSGTSKGSSPCATGSTTRRTNRCAPTVRHSEPQSWLESSVNATTGTVPRGVYALLTDGTTAEIRPAAPGDLPAGPAMHEAMSPAPSYLRFFSYSRLSAEEEAKRVCRPPGPGHQALLALCGGEIAGVASYEVGGSGHQAEVAFAVPDRMHGRGLGTL